MRNIRQNVKMGLFKKNKKRKKGKKKERRRDI